MKDKIISLFITLPTGVKRILIVLTTFPVFCGIVTGISEYRNNLEVGIIAILFFSVIYWAVVFAVLWVVDGFRKPAEKINLQSQIYDLLERLDAHEKAMHLTADKYVELSKKVSAVQEKEESKIGDLARKIKCVEQGDWYLLQIYLEEIVVHLQEDEYGVAQYFKEVIGDIQEEKPFAEIKKELLYKLELYLENS